MFAPKSSLCRTAEFDTPSVTIIRCRVPFATHSFKISSEKKTKCYVRMSKEPQITRKYFLSKTIWKSSSVSETVKPNPSLFFNVALNRAFQMEGNPSPPNEPCPCDCTWKNKKWSISKRLKNIPNRTHSLPKNISNHRACGAAPCTIECHRWSRHDSTWRYVGSQKACSNLKQIILILLWNSLHSWKSNYLTFFL